MLDLHFADFLHILRALCEYFMESASNHGRPHATPAQLQGPGTDTPSPDRLVEDRRLHVDAFGVEHPQNRDGEPISSACDGRPISGMQEQQQWSRERETYKARITQLKSSEQRWIREQQGYEERVARLESRLQFVESHRSLAEENLRDARSLLEIKSTELREATAYMTKVDDVPVRDAQRILEDLNSSIYQFASSASEAFQGRYRVHDSTEAETAGAVLGRSGLLSPQILSAIRSEDHNEDTLLVQTALQMLMSTYTWWLCRTWDFQMATASRLEQIYTHVKVRNTYMTYG